MFNEANGGRDSGRCVSLADSSCGDNHRNTRTAGVYSPGRIQAVQTVDSVASTAVRQPAMTSAIIVFRKQPLDSILSAVAAYHGAAVDFRDVSKKELYLYYRWDQSLSLDETVAQLNNFERINLTLSDKVIFLRDGPVLQSVGTSEPEHLGHLHRQLRKEGPSWQRDGVARQRSFSHHAVTGATA